MGPTCSNNLFFIITYFSSITLTISPICSSRLPSYTAVTAQAIAYSLANADSYTRPHLWTHQFDAMAADVAQAYDLNFSRTLEDRP